MNLRGGVLILCGLAAACAGGGASPSAAGIGCAEQDYQDMTGQPSAEVVIVGFSNGFEYLPKCLKVSAGTAVMLPADDVHPLQALPDVNGVVNPFRSPSASQINVTKTLSNVGFYGYFCTHHRDTGTIQVVQ